MNIIKEYLNETIITKKKQRKIICKLEKDLNSAGNKIVELKENEKDILNKMNDCKKKFKNEHTKYVKYEKEMSSILKDKELRIKQLEKEIKSLEKELKK